VDDEHPLGRRFARQVAAIAEADRAGQLELYEGEAVGDAGRLREAVGEESAADRPRWPGGARGVWGVSLLRLRDAGVR
jgi:hypothetical protein